jgi:pimeloyl-ACP methyl ester carboxylesterase
MKYSSIKSSRHTSTEAYYYAQRPSRVKVFQLMDYTQFTYFAPPHSAPDFLSHGADRWAFHLLQRGRPERRADASPAALPSSSRMFEPLFAPLADRYHLVAPDYPGFGHSDWPDPKKFAYTFDHYAEIMNHFTDALGLSRFALYTQDYGGPSVFVWP